MAGGTESNAGSEHCTEVKRCYQSTRQLLKEHDLEEIQLPRTDFQCLASTVLPDLGDVATTLRECLKTAVDNEVKVPRSAVIPLMKSVAAWLATRLQAGTSSGPVTVSLDDSQKHIAGGSSSGPAAVSFDDCQKNVAGSVHDDVPVAANWRGRVLVVGAGATGACVALRLSSALGNNARIVVWEKARGAGGRMSTNRQDGINMRADMGAPYLSFDSQDRDCSEVADLLLKSRVCADIPSDLLSNTPERPSGKRWRHLAGVEGGVNDALKKILEKAKAQVCYDKRVSSLDQQHGRWCAKPFSGPAEDFDAVILAVPGCGIGGDNLNKIHGGWERMIGKDQNQELMGVQHDQRWAFALFFSSDSAARCDSFFGSHAVEKTVEDDVVHLLCYQSRKTAKVGGPSPHNALALVAHTTVEWARMHSRANGRDQRLLDEVTERVKRILGLNRARLLASKVITWKQCHVTKPIPSRHVKGPYMLLNSAPPLLLAGDYFTESNFGGCLQSAFAAADALAQVVGESTNVGGKKRHFDTFGAGGYKKSRSGW